MTRRGTVLAVAVATVLIAACSSRGDTAPTTPPSQPAVVTSTTEPDPTTTVAPTTTESPTTTLDPAEALAADVEADFRAGIDQLNVALMDVSSQSNVDIALKYLGGESRQSVEGFIQQYRDGNLRILEEPLTAPKITIEQRATEDLAELGVVVMQVCEIDPWVVVETGAGPDGTDAIVDSNVYAYRSTIRLRDIDGTWAVIESLRIGEWTGVEACPPE